MIEHRGQEGSRRKYRIPKKKSNETIDVRIYCDEVRCECYLKGRLGVGGIFMLEDEVGFANINTQVWRCSEHRKQ